MNSDKIKTLEEIDAFLNDDIHTGILTDDEDCGCSSGSEQQKYSCASCCPTQLSRPKRANADKSNFSLRKPKRKAETLCPEAHSSNEIPLADLYSQAEYAKIKNDTRLKNREARLRLKHTKLEDIVEANITLEESNAFISAKQAKQRVLVRLLEH